MFKNATLGQVHIQHAVTNKHCLLANWLKTHLLNLKVLLIITCVGYKEDIILAIGDTSYVYVVVSLARVDNLVYRSVDYWYGLELTIM